MPHSVDLFYSYRSPYSYLALPKTLELAKSHDVTINLRAVYPIAVRIPGFFKTANPQFAPYVMRDSRRVAEHAGIPFRWPKPDPIVQDMTTFEVAAEQPRIRRITRLCAHAQREGRAFDFTLAVAPVMWDGSVDGWHEGDHLSKAANAAGFDLAAMDAAITADPDRYEAVIKDNETSHAASGHWGVPTFVFEGEPFFGQDRVELLLWRMKNKGLAARNAAAG